MVKALFPIGKTQWAKWRPEQQIAFNEARAEGVPFPDAVKYVNELELIEVNIQPKPEHHGILGVLEDVAEVATTVASVAATVTPVVGMAKTLVKATKKKGK